MVKTRVVKWGNSLAVRIPKAAAEDACMREGDSLVIEASEDHIELRRAERIPTLAELVAQITPENRHREVATGPDRGKEKVEW